MVNVRRSRAKLISQNVPTAPVNGFLGYAPEGWTDCTLNLHADDSCETSKVDKADMNESPNCYTVYLTPSGIEIYEGCEDFHNYQVICTCTSYESALSMARVSASIKNLPLIDRTYER